MRISKQITQVEGIKIKYRQCERSSVPTVKSAKARAPVLLEGKEGEWEADFSAEIILLGIF